MREGRLRFDERGVFSATQTDNFLRFLGYFPVRLGRDFKKNRHVLTGGAFLVLTSLFCPSLFAICSLLLPVSPAS